MDLNIFLATAVGISLSGVMAPGPITAATLAAGSHNKHAGALVALGHAVVEIPLILLIMAGISVLFKQPGVQIAIGLIGGGFLVHMGVQMLREMHAGPKQENRYTHQNPLRIGIILTAGNPYFLLWWATVGMALAADAWTFGPFAFTLFALIHWLCDLIWLEILSWTSHQGTRLFGPHQQKIILLVCGLALLAFGAKFLYAATCDMGHYL
jgi:threonine/homoserine/homoserine lactone efflux protein